MELDRIEFGGVVGGPVEEGGPGGVIGRSGRGTYVVVHGEWGCEGGGGREHLKGGREEQSERRRGCQRRGEERQRWSARRGLGEDRRCCTHVGWVPHVGPVLGQPGELDCGPTSRVENVFEF